MKASYLLFPLLLACRQPVIVSKFPDATPIKFCDLLSQQKDFQNKIVRVRATYRSGFEMSALGSKGCEDAAWVDFDTKVQELSPTHVMKKFMSISDKSMGVEIIVVGYLLPPNKPFTMFGRTARLGFGHLNAYDYQFHLIAIEGIQ